ncbi:MAG: NF038122 family metalloprotease [Acidiferrobacteraceae bacterium]
MPVKKNPVSRVRNPGWGSVRKAMVLLVAVGLTFGVPEAHALTFNVTYDSSVSSAPAGFTTAFQDAISFYEQSFSNPITVNLNVGWGEVNNTPLSSGSLGESLSYGVGYDYASVRNGLVSNGSPGYLPTSDPTGGRTITVTTADAKALNLNTGQGPNASDGAVGFSSGVSWTFDPNNRAVSGEYDFIGTAEHEISEVLGRQSGLDPTCTSGSLCPESVQDLFRYTSAGTLDLTGTNAYFSTDGGKTKINTFNGNSAVGDLGDWAGATTDAFNYQMGTGTEYPVTAGDITLMRTLGYTVPVPEPTNAALLATALTVLVPVARNRRKRITRA